ncbi:MAG TPA: hypothetical protein VM077_04650 [Candidatus Limnocylindrales bacterium]|nr:hypothetical protein [Candidatus Limnocylindrales bacterium]
MIREREPFVGPMMGQFRLERVDAMEQAAGEFDMPFERIAVEGETLLTDTGKRIDIMQGHMFVSVGTGLEGWLTRFWKRVDEISPKAPPIKVSQGKI